MRNARMTWVKVVIGIAFVAILYNLAAALYHMMTDAGRSGRMARSLTWRIGLSVGLIVLVLIGIVAGVIEPHGVRVGH
jgi:succinate dehydrogenase/fumarate reductase cytochrome b subunit